MPMIQLYVTVHGIVVCTNML